MSKLFNWAYFNWKHENKFRVFVLGKFLFLVLLEMKFVEICYLQRKGGGVVYGSLVKYAAEIMRKEMYEMTIYKCRGVYRVVHN